MRYVSSGRTDDKHGFLYLVMELVEGRKLRDAAREMPHRDRVAAMIEVLGGLEYMHAQGVYHRDVKEANIVVQASDNQPVLVDFGLAYLVGEELDDARTRHTLGTPGYVPQEALADPKASRSPKYDIFSAGATLYSLFADRPPNIQAYQPLAAIDPRLATLDTIVRRATAPLHERYEDAATFAAQLRDWIKQQQAHDALTDPSPLTSRLLKKLVERDDKRAKEQSEKEHGKRLLEEAFGPLRDLAVEAGVQAFNEMASALEGRSPRVEVVGRDATSEDQGIQREAASLRPICALHYCENVNRNIAFAWSPDCTNPLGVSRQRKPLLQWPQKNRHYKVVDPHVYDPILVVYQGGKSQSPRRTLLGAIAAVSPVKNPRAERFEMRLVGLPKGRSEPVELESSQAIKDYIIRAIARSMNITL